MKTQAQEYHHNAVYKACQSFVKMLARDKVAGPFTIIVRAGDDNTAITASSDEVYVSYILPESLPLAENYYCRLVHISGFEKVPLMVWAPSLLESATICKTISPILGISNTQANRLQPVKSQYLPCGQTLKIERLDGSPFTQDYKNNKSIVIMLRMVPESWVKKFGQNC